MMNGIVNVCCLLCVDVAIGSSGDGDCVFIPDRRCRHEKMVGQAGEIMWLSFVVL